ncbi:MAG: DUF4149 domain-containing protein [Mariprofundaceae bacterium]|nr:DUF4149 domain-containing protein [Mariprofundaceae bacterium]
MKRIPIECIRAASIRLALAMMLGLIVVSGYVVVPLLFAETATPAEAGRVAGELFHLVNIGVLILAAAVAGFWARIKDIGRLNWSMLTAVVLLLAVNEFIISPQLAEIKALVGPVSQLAADDTKRAEFGMLHGIAAIFHLLAAMASAVLVVLGGAGRGACKES